MASFLSLRVVLVLLTYCVSGTLLTLVNKVVIKVFPFTCSLLVLQNAIAVILLLVGSRTIPEKLGPLPNIDCDQLRVWGPLTFLFAVMLYSSLEALKFISAVTLVVMRNLTTVVVAAGEHIALGVSFTRPAFLAMCGMLTSAAVYGAADMKFNPTGYAWLAVNIVSSSIYQVYVKSVATKDGTTPMGMSYLNNAISIPMLAAASSAIGENPLPWIALPHALSTWAMLLLSGFLGYLLSTSAFFLNQVISATSIMVANNTNKFAVIIFSELFIERSLGVWSTAGACMVIVFAYIYTRDRSSTSVSTWQGSFVLASLTFSWIILLLAMMGDSRLNPKDGLRVFSRSGTINPVFTPLLMPPPPVGYSNHTLDACVKATGSNLTKHCDSPCLISMILPEAINNMSIFDYYGVNGSIPEATLLAKIQIALAAEWGPSPPSVDLYLRTGCHGAAEAVHLFKSIEVFWPNFLGQIVVVLDAADRNASLSFVPSKSIHKYKIVFEHVPCMPARVFNQLSYLSADQHCDADVIVTIDSDCVFHSLVTPDLLFKNGKVMLAHSTLFQAGAWNDAAEYFTGPSTYKRHTMVTQPVSFHRSTFVAYREWFVKTKGKCHLDAVIEYLAIANQPTLRPLLFCWMCQLGTFIDVTQQTSDKYALVDLDNGTQIYQRLAVHTTYEKGGFTDVANASRAYQLQGLCRFLPDEWIKSCANESSTLPDSVTFTYASWPWPGLQHVLHAQRISYVSRMKALLLKANSVAQP